jgi:hypothetical protein
MVKAFPLNELKFFALLASSQQTLVLALKSRGLPRHSLDTAVILKSGEREARLPAGLCASYEFGTKRARGGPDLSRFDRRF